MNACLAYYLIGNKGRTNEHFRGYFERIKAHPRRSQLVAPEKEVLLNLFKFDAFPFLNVYLRN